MIPDSADPAEVERVRTAQGARVKELTDEPNLRAKVLDTLPTRKWHTLEITGAPGEPHPG